MQAGLLVDSVEERRLLALLGEQRSAQIKLEALGNVVLKLDLGLEDVGGRPRLGEDDAVLVVGILGFKIPGNGGGLALAASNLEGDARRGLGFDLEVGAGVRVVAAQQIVGRLAEILFANTLGTAHHGLH